MSPDEGVGTEAVDVTVDLQAIEDEAHLSIEEKIAALEEKVDRSDQEIDRLQVLASEAAAPWWKKASTVSVALAFVALAFSGITTWVSSERLQAEDVRNNRAELREILQRLSATQLEGATFFAEYDQDVANQLNNQLTVEQTLLARQALEVMDRIPEHVTPNEYAAVGEALLVTDDFADSQRAFSKSLELSVEEDRPADQMIALSGLARLAFLLSDFEQGRDYYEQAIAVFDDADPDAELTVDFYRAQLQVEWAGIELQMGNCDEVGPHIDAAAALVDGMIAGLRQLVLAGVGTLDASDCIAR